MSFTGCPAKVDPLNFLSVRPNCEIREKKLEYQGLRKFKGVDFSGTPCIRQKEKETTKGNF